MNPSTMRFAGAALMGGGLLAYFTTVYPLIDALGEPLGRALALGLSGTMVFPGMQMAFGRPMTVGKALYEAAVGFAWGGVGGYLIGSIPSTPS